MFFFAGVLLLWALGTFGAVLPTSSLPLSIVWLSGVGVIAIRRIAREGRINWIIVTTLTAGSAAILWFGPKLPLWIFALLWSWEATRNHPQKVPRYLQFLLFVGVLEALLGLTQYFLAPGWILGYQNTVGSAVSGTLINRNHFAGLIEMLIAVSIGLGYVAVRHYGEMSRCYVYILAGSFMALALTFSLSRMGIFSFLMTLLFLSVLLFLRKSERKVSLGIGLSVFGLLLAGVLWIGIDVVVERYSVLFGADAALQEGRIPIFRDTIRMIERFPGGVGIGKYQDFFRPFQTLHPEYVVDHAHNDYLETVAEWGVVPGILFWVGVLIIWVTLIRSFVISESIEKQGILLTCVGSIFAILLHSVADFNLQIPSNAMLFFGFVGMGLGVLFPSKDTAVRNSGGRVIT